MPYEIIKVNKGYHVINPITNKIYNKKPHKLKREAIAHQKALYANANDTGISGSGLIGDFIGNIKGRFSGIRTDYPPKVRKLLAEYGSKPWIIKNIVIYRQPVQKFITKILNFISLGTFGSMIEKLGFDTMFHLYIRVDCVNTTTFAKQSFRIEKNQVINISKWNDKTDNSNNKLNITMNNDYFNSIGGLDLNQFLNNARYAIGDDNFFKYSAFGGRNCQNFILALMQNNKLITPTLNTTAKDFIFQDVSTLSKEMPLTAKFAQGLTDLAAGADTLIHGQGLIGI